MVYSCQSSIFFFIIFAFERLGYYLRNKKKCALEMQIKWNKVDGKSYIYTRTLFCSHSHGHEFQMKIYAWADSI